MRGVLWSVLSASPARSGAWDNGEMGFLFRYVCSAGMAGEKPSFWSTSLRVSADGFPGGAGVLSQGGGNGCCRFSPGAFP